MPKALNRIQNIDAIVLDKTGTLTEGKPSVTGINWLVSKEKQPELENILLAMEKQSGHPLAGAIVSSITARSNGHLVTDSFENVPGQGLKAKYAGKTYLAGNLKLITGEGLQLNTVQQQEAERLQEEAQTVIFFCEDTRLIAIIGLADTLKKTTADAIRQMKQSGISVYMLTGDNQQTAGSIALHAGIDNYKCQYAAFG